MNKAELIEAITERLGDKKSAQNAVEAVVDTIQRAVAKGEKVAITGFGVFERQVRGARTARNPATGATIKLKKTAVPKFRAGTGFKDVVSGAKKLAAPAKSTTKATTGRSAAAKSTAGTTRATKSASGRAAGGTTATRAAKSATKSATKSTAGKTTTGRKTATSRSTAKTAASKTSTTKSTSARKSTGAAKKSTARKRS